MLAVTSSDVQRDQLLVPESMCFPRDLPAAAKETLHSCPAPSFIDWQVFGMLADMANGDLRKGSRWADMDSDHSEDAGVGRSRGAFKGNCESTAFLPHGG